MNDNTKGRVSVGLIEMNEYEIVQAWFNKKTWLTLMLVLTSLTITANVHPSLKMTGLLWEVSVNNLLLKSKPNQQEHCLADLAIVAKIHLLNSIFGVTLVATILKTAFYYFKVWKPFQEAKVSIY